MTRYSSRLPALHLRHMEVRKIPSEVNERGSLKIRVW
jgi:hypothetical protein